MTLCPYEITSVSRYPPRLKTWTNMYFYYFLRFSPPKNIKKKKKTIKKTREKKDQKLLWVFLNSLRFWTQRSTPQKNQTQINLHKSYIYPILSLSLSLSLQTHKRKQNEYKTWILARFLNFISIDCKELAKMIWVILLQWYLFCNR